MRKYLTAILLGVAMLAAYDLTRAEEVMLPIQCNATACVMPRELVTSLLEAHNAHVERVREVEAELAKLKEIKGCAKLDVTEPPKPPVIKNDGSRKSM